MIVRGVKKSESLGISCGAWGQAEGPRQRPREPGVAAAAGEGARVAEDLDHAAHELEQAGDPHLSRATAACSAR